MVIEVAQAVGASDSQAEVCCAFPGFDPKWVVGRKDGQGGMLAFLTDFN